MSWKIYFIILGIIIVVGISFLLFNSNGILKFNQLQSEVNSLQATLDSLNAEVKMLRAEIDSLRNNSAAKIEKLAREKYHMALPNESVIKIEKQD